MTAPVDVRLFPGTIRQPDVLFVRQENRSRIGSFVDGHPDWVSEVISPGSREIDEVTKLEEYARAGIPEYWLLDPDSPSIRVYTLQGDSYILTTTALAGQMALSSAIAGFEVAVDEVFDV